MTKRMVIQTHIIIENLITIKKMIKRNNHISKDKMEHKNNTFYILIRKKSKMNFKINGCLKLLNNKIIRLYNILISNNIIKGQIKMTINKNNKI